MIDVVLRFGLVTTAAFLPLAATAHHSIAGTFDTSRIVEAEGVVTSVIWRNPHVRFSMTDADGSGELEQWDIEMTSLTTLRRRGVSDLRIDVGDTVRVAGNPAKDDSNQMYVRNLLTSDRGEIVLGNDGPRWSDQVLGATGPGFGAEGDRSRPELGIFRVWSTPINSGALGRLWNASYPLTLEAEAAVAAFNPAIDAPTLNCAPKGMPTIMSQPYPMQIVETDGAIVLTLEEYDTVRTIYMDGNEPAQAEPRPLGYSVGRWEGGDLIVETEGIRWPHFNTSGIPLGDSVETTETFSLREDGARLYYTLTVTDPATFTEPVVLDKSWLWLPGMTIEPFNCKN
jgi:hypothetical protein